LLPILTLDLHDIDFCFFLLSCLFRVVARMMQCPARVAGVYRELLGYRELLEAQATVSYWMAWRRLPW
jgi:hypothetical protein